MRLTSALAALAAAGTVLFASSVVEPAHAMGPAGPATAKKADTSLVETVGHRRWYRNRVYYYPRYYRPYYRSYYYGGYYPYYRPYYRPYYYGAYYPYYRPYYYGPRFYGGGIGIYGRGFGVRIGW